MNPTENSNKIKVTLEPIGRRVEVDVNTTVLGVARQGGVDITAACGGNGSCGMCKFIPISGDYSPLSSTEEETLPPAELTSGFRLACMTRVLSDAVLHFPPESLGTMQRLQLEGQKSNIAIKPFVTAIEIELSSPPEIIEHPAPEQFIKDVSRALMNKYSLPVQLDLAQFQSLAGNGWKATLALGNNRIIAILPPGSPLIGYAADIGTTKIAGYLVDLRTGRTLASGGVTNPQIAYGEDVINRIRFIDENPGEAGLLHKILVHALNDLLENLCQQINIRCDQVVDSVMVGKTVMHHLLADLPVHSLGTSPYTTPALKEMLFAAGEVGIKIAPGGYMYLPPNIAGFVGGDHIATLLSTNAKNLGKTVLVVDIGTNTEISLIHEDDHLACSCASGPAFEGAHISEGMRAIPGAIERLFIEQDVVHVQTIQNKPAVGICGSGILDAVAELRKEKIIDRRGSFNKTDRRVLLVKGRPEFMLVDAKHNDLGRDITLGRRDVNQIQLAKAAIRSGIEVLLKEARIDAEEIQLVLLAGAFGTYLSIASAIKLGMFPPIPIERFQQIGNAAGKGARDMLVSTQMRAEGERMPAQITYVELASVKDYMDIYMQAIGFDE